MKTLVGTIPQRFLVKPFRVEGVSGYGLDNCYPQTAKLLINSSGRAKSSVDMYASFIEGQGFSNKDLWDYKVNSDSPKALTGDKLLRDNVSDFSVFHGFAIHINWNANFKWSELHCVPFEYCRLAMPDIYGVSPKVAIYNNWDRVKSRTISKKDIQLVDFWNPDPVVIQAQVDAAGGWDKYKGQVLWFSLDGQFTYPFCSLESVIEDVDSESQSKIYKNNNIRTRFLADGMIIHPKAEEDAGTRRDRIAPTFGTQGGNPMVGMDSVWESNSFSDNFRTFQGAEESMKLMDVEYDGANIDDAFKYIEFKKDINDTLYKFTEESIQNNIRKCLRIPSILLSDEVAGKLGNSSEISDATNFYNGITAQRRRIFEEVYTEIFLYASVPVKGNDFSITLLSLLTEDSGTILELLGPKGVGAIQILLADPTLTPEQKVNCFVILFGLKLEDAQAVVNGTPIQSAA